MSINNVQRRKIPRTTPNSVLKDTQDTPRTETDNDCLQLAVKAVNDTLGPEGLCPTLLVYGSIPRPLRRTPAETQIRRAEALDMAMKLVQKEQAKRKIALAMRHPGGPKAKEHEAELQRLPAGAPVLVNREKTKRCEGPFLFINVEGSTVVVQTPSGRKSFRSHVVKSANKVSEDQWDKKDGISEETSSQALQSETERCLTDHINYCNTDCAYSILDLCDDNAMVLHDDTVEEMPTDVMRALFGSENVTFMRPNDNHNFSDSRTA